MPGRKTSMNTVSAPLLLLSLLAGLLLTCATPAYSRNASCLFKATGLALSFDILDPSIRDPVQKAVQIVNTGAGEAGDCNTNGATLSVQIVDGASSRELKNGAGASIPYALFGFPVSNIPQPGNNKYASFLAGGVFGRIEAGAYENAPAGNYTDTVTISVSP